LIDGITTKMLGKVFASLLWIEVQMCHGLSEPCADEGCGLLVATPYALLQVDTELLHGTQAGEGASVSSLQ
jgi:hypothetical protein